MKKNIVIWAKEKLTTPSITARKSLLVDEMARLEEWAMQFACMAEGQQGSDSELAELFNEMSEAILGYWSQIGYLNLGGVVPSIDNVAVMKDATCPANATPAKKVAMFFTWAKGTRQLAMSFTEVDERGLRSSLQEIANQYVKLGLAFASRLGINVTASRDEAMMGAFAI